MLAFLQPYQRDTVCKPEELRSRISIMSFDELHTLERARRDADRQYNDALTAFDAALIRATSPTVAAFVADSTPPPLPSGWRGWRLRVVRQWLTPWIERQHTFNARTADAIGALIGRDPERAI